MILKCVPVLAVVFALAISMPARAQESNPNEPDFPVYQEPELVKAEVLEVVAEDIRNIPGTEVPATYQTIRAKILEGTKKGAVVKVENDYLELAPGEIFFLMHSIREDQVHEYAVMEPYRLHSLFFFAALFVLTVCIFGGKQGLRGLLSLIGSFSLIMFVLLPAILKGYSPLLIITAVSSLIIILGSYITHGFNWTTSSAVFGMIATVIITGVLAYVAVPATQLSGYYSDETVSLNFSTQGLIDFEGLLLGAIIIGLLGVLYDSAIGQAVSVEELRNVGPHLSRRKIYNRALRIGREHIGALVNTLAIAYVGASLPLLLLFYSVSAGTLESIVNTEVLATEIIRILIGSIGIILAVPITTAISVYILVKPVKDGSTTKAVEEEKAIEHMGHTH